MVCNQQGMNATPEFRIEQQNLRLEFEQRGQNMIKYQSVATNRKDGSDMDKKCRQNFTSAAEALDVSRNTVRKYL